MIRVKINKGSDFIKLNNIAFISNFYILIVLYNILISKGMFWDKKKQDISYYGKYLYKMEKYYK